MSARKKILYIVSEMEDFLSSRLPLALAAKENGFEICVAAPGATGNQKITLYGFRGFDLPPMKGKLSLSHAMILTRSIDRIIAESNADIVHTVTLKYAFLTGLAMRRHKRVKAIYTIAGLGYLFSSESFKAKLMLGLLRPMITNVFRSAFITVQNPDDLDALLRRKVVKPQQCKLIRGSGIDLQRFAPSGAQSSQAPIVLMPTRLVHNKGIAVFIEAADILKRRGVNARFQIAGGVPAHNPLAISQEEMQRMIAGKPVEWLGKVSDMPALYNSATLIVYPSYYGEGIPRVLLEAAACGKAIVTTDHTGCREAVTHNDNGLLVPVKDAGATADAVEKLLSEPQLRRAMETRSRARAEAEFDVRLIAAQTVDVYKNL